MVEYAGLKNKIKVILGSISTHELFVCTGKSSCSSDDKKSEFIKNTISNSNPSSSSSSSFSCCTDLNSNSSSSSGPKSIPDPGSDSSRSSDFNSSSSSGSNSSLGSSSDPNSVFNFHFTCGFQKMLQKNHGTNYVNILFIDHDKSKYFSDLKIIESLGLLKSGK